MKETTMSLIRTVVICVLLSVTAALAQNITGTLTGAVEDQTGAGVQQTTVVALNTDTGISYKTVSGAAGVYVLPLLPLGNYQITVEAAGFKKFVRSGLVLGADERLRVDCRLELGPLADQITVSGAAPVVTTDQATLGASVAATNFTSSPIGRPAA